MQRISGRIAAAWWRERIGATLEGVGVCCVVSKIACGIGHQ
jgi:hypothetical protein